MVTRKHASAVDNSEAEKALARISASLANADKFYDQATSPASDPAHAQANLQPIMGIIQDFVALSNMLLTQKPRKDAALRKTMRSLVQEHREIYRTELRSILEALQQKTDYNPPTLRHAMELDVDIGDFMQKHISVAENKNNIFAYKTLASNPLINVSLPPSSLDKDLEAFRKKVRLTEEELHIPTGALQTFLKLDESSFFAFTANPPKLPDDPDNNPAAGKKFIVHKADRYADAIGAKDIVDLLDKNILARNVGETVLHISNNPAATKEMVRLAVDGTRHLN